MVQKGNVLVLCNDQKVAQYYTAAIPGTRAEVPAASCSAIQSAGLPEGYYYIGSSAAQAVRIYCRLGQAVDHWLDFDAIGGQPILYFDFEDSLTDVMSLTTLSPVGSNFDYTDNGRIGKGLTLGTDNTYFQVAVDDYILQGAWSLSAWVYPTGIADNSDLGIFGHGEDSATSQSLHCGVRKNTAYFGYFGSVCLSVVQIVEYPHFSLSFFPHPLGFPTLFFFFFLAPHLSLLPVSK